MIVKIIIPDIIDIYVYSYKFLFLTLPNILHLCKRGLNLCPLSLIHGLEQFLELGLCVIIYHSKLN